jgi:hypothetical protein
VQVFRKAACDPENYKLVWLWEQSLELGNAFNGFSLYQGRLQI